MDYQRGRVSGNPRIQSPANDESIAIASDVFDHFCSATTLKSILGLHRNMCDLLKLRPTNLPNFYPKLKSKLRSWKANALWKRLDIRANHKCYNRGRVCASTRVLVIGAGPCGLRTAIECQLLGAKVVVTEKRDRLSRNNVLHLWPFVINDLRALGAKKFFGKFCAGAIDHISIRQLQCILLKIALLLGVEFHEGVSFENLIEPTVDSTERHGWRAEVIPQDHPVSQYEFDILIGADGKRNTLHGFKRKEFRGKLAIAITANFINKHSEAEARVQEISGVAFIFNQKFFKDLYQETGIDLENIVYYKDETHYFVMTAKKHSLINKGVILVDLADTAKLLAPENVDREALMKYAREAAEFSTKYQMPNLEFAVNHYGQPDVAMFDFTSMYAAENASRVIERHGYRLLLCLVGDSLLEPFWPTGSGCARGFLSSLDAAWAVRSWGLGDINPLEILAERESIYRLLGQTTPENLQRDYAAYTLSPATRYPNLNRFLVTPIQVKYLYDTDNPERVELPLPKIQEEVHKKKRRRESVQPDTLLHWIQKQVNSYNLHIDNLTHSFKNGLVLCAIIHRYHPELVDWSSLNENNVVGNNQLAFDLLEKECGIPPVMTGKEMAECTVPDKLTMLSYLSQIYETFHGEIPQTIKHSKIDLKDLKKEYSTAKIRTTTAEDWNIKRAKAQAAPSASNAVTPRLSGKRPTRLSHLASSERRRKRRSGDKVAEQREAEIIENRNERMSRRKQQRKHATEQFYKSIHMLHSNALSRGDDTASPPEEFEDYSIYLYRQTAPDFGDRVKKLEQKLLNLDRDRDRYQDYRQTDENMSGRVKNLQQQFKQRPQEKKPPDLLRAIGKIESSDWHVREIEKKILENKLGKPKTAEKEKVPKWSREQFMARQSKMEKKSNLERTDSLNEKYLEIDKSIKLIDKKLREGSNLEQGERGNNKVASMAEQFDIKPVETPVQKSKSIVLNLPAGSEMCHFCGTRVYLMERLSAEGRFFHRGCFRCQYCSITLRLGFYHFDAPNGKFYCPQHANMQGKTRNIRPEKDALDSKAKGRTPERIEFANLHESENEEAPSQMDEDEWTDRNFGQSTAEVDSSDLSDSDSDDLYEEALERAGEVPTKPDGPRLSYVGDSGNSEDSSDDESSSYYDYSTDEDAKDSETDDEEIKMAREIRRKEFNVRTAAPHDTDTTTGSDTEVLSESEETESSNESRDSATEISTDSEFKLDGTTPTVDNHKPFPVLQVNDAYICKTRGPYKPPKKVPPVERRNKKPVIEEEEIELNLPPLVPDIATLAPPKAPLKGFFSLNRTHSTEGIASKVSLELKKQYLFGTPNIAHNIQKSGSASMLDSSKFKSFHNNISEQQKLLNPPKLAVTSETIKHICCLNAAKSDSDDPKLAAKVETTDTTTTEEQTVIPTPIEVPEWNESTSFDDVDTDSLSSFDNNDKNYQELSHSSSTQNQLNVPKVQINDDDMAMDSLLIIEPSPVTPPAPTPTTVPAKFEWISPRNTEPKVLNPPKMLRRKSSSELSSSERDVTAAGAALTETELSDWARDENVSADDFEDVDYEQFDSRKKRAKAVNHFVKLGDLDQHVCGKNGGGNEKEEENSLPSHLAELDSIEYMDTISEDAGATTPGYETITSATNVAMLKNQGYVQFVNVTPQNIQLTPKPTPQINLAKPPSPTPPPPTTQVTQPPSPRQSPQKSPSPLPPKLENTKEEKTEEPEYIEHVQRLQTKITEFGNVKDSIDIRKSKKTSPKKVLTTSEKLQEMAKERNKQKNLIHEMVLEKLKSEKRRKSAQKPQETIPVYATVNKKPNVVFQKDDRPSSINDHILFKEEQPKKTPTRTKSFSELTQPDCRIRKSQSSGHVLASAVAAAESEHRKSAASLLRKSEPCLAVEKQLQRSGAAGNDKRKSIIQAVTDFFHKRKSESPDEGMGKTSRSNSSPGDSSSAAAAQQRFSLFRISPKSKDKAKLKTTPPKDSPQKYTSKEDNHLVNQRSASPEEASPPPVPPLPPLECCLNDPLLYSDRTWSSIDTLDCSASAPPGDESIDQRKHLRRSQHKRLRIAQEVQRKLEETEVKTRELEARGVELEKKLRNEGGGGDGVPGTSDDEYALLTEWLTLMRELAALRRYERELLARAEDVRLEERHSMLQAQLNEPEIVDQIMDIAEKRKSLALMLEKNNQSYVKEDNDLEALMLQKGLQLTSIEKTSPLPPNNNNNSKK